MRRAVQYRRNASPMPVGAASPGIYGSAPVDRTAWRRAIPNTTPISSAAHPATADDALNAKHTGAETGAEAAANLAQAAIPALYDQSSTGQALPGAGTIRQRSVSVDGTSGVRTPETKGSGLSRVVSPTGRCLLSACLPRIRVFQKNGLFPSCVHARFVGEVVCCGPCCFSDPQGLSVTTQYQTTTQR